VGLYANLHCGRRKGARRVTKRPAWKGKPQAWRRLSLAGPWSYCGCSSHPGCGRSRCQSLWNHHGPSAALQRIWRRCRQI